MIVNRIKFKHSHRVMCYMDEDFDGITMYYKVFSGRPCDPNKVIWRFNNRSEALSFGKNLMRQCGYMDKGRIFEGIGGGGVKKGWQLKIKRICSTFVY